MRRDALELDRFYRSRRGQITQAMIERRLGAIWPDLRDLDLLGLGYATPYLDTMRPTARRAIGFMPAGQGALIPAGPSHIAMGDETHLPFPDALFDRILMIHLLEEADSLPAILRETWRVMAPEGRMVIVAAARAGAWALVDSTPFGHGRPFSRGQLDRMLDDAMFQTTAWSRALYVPPFRWMAHDRLARMWEGAGESLWAGLGGVIMVEAIKRTGAVQPRLRAAPARARILEAGGRPALSPPQTYTDPSGNRGQR